MQTKDVEMVKRCRGGIQKSHAGPETNLKFNLKFNSNTWGFVLLVPTWAWYSEKVFGNQIFQVFLLPSVWVET